MLGHCSANDQGLANFYGLLILVIIKNINKDIECNHLARCVSIQYSLSVHNFTHNLAY